MDCSKCKLDPKFHSFEFVQRRTTGEAIFYTSPAKGKQLEMKEEDIKDYIAHMDSASSSAWIWIFDCSGLQSCQMPSLKILQKFVHTIQERYTFVLKNIYLVNMNWKMHMILNLAKPFIKDDIKHRLIISHSTLELVSHGFDGKLIKLINK